MDKKVIYADLHVHSTASDGVLTPEELVLSASRIGLQVIGITDHDTIGGIKAADRISENAGVTVIPGIELSCGWENMDTSVHVLGLFINEDSSELNELLKRQQQSRSVRAEKMLQKLEYLGFNVSELREGFANSPELVIGRPHVARFLQEKGHVSDFQVAFSKYLGRNCPAYVPKEHLSPAEGIRIIHGAGGVAILAHPGLIRDWPKIWELIKDLPWDGLETYYSEHSPSQISRFEKIVEEKGWLSSGGSDYHGEYGKHANRLGRFGLEQHQYSDFIQKCRDRGLLI